MWGADLKGEIEEMFSLLIVPVLAGDPDEEEERGARWQGFHHHKHLNLVKQTTKEALTEAQRKERRRKLEANRRTYKTLKQRDYDRARKVRAA